MEQHPVGQVGVEQRRRLDDRARRPGRAVVVEGERGGEDGAVMVKRAAVLDGRERGDVAVQPPQGQTHPIRLFRLGPRGQLFAFQTQGRRGGPAEAAGHQAEDHDEGGRAAPFAAKPFLHGARSPGDGASMGCRSGAAM